MYRKVLTYPHPCLLKVSDEVSDVRDVQHLSNDLSETVVLYNGLGLSAPQIGINKRVIVVMLAGKPLVMINPEIISAKGFFVSDEGCLSIPGRRVRKTRFKTLEVNYLDLKGDLRNIKTSGLVSACIQHEIDHLNGILIVKE